MKIVLAIILVFQMLLLINTKASAHWEPKTVVVEIRDSKFFPNKIELDQGDAILFKNIDSKAHWPASNLHPSHGIYPEFDPKVSIRPGESWKFVFEKEGKWRFHDHLVPISSGEITVKKNPYFTPKPKNEKAFLSGLLKPMMLQTEIFISSIYLSMFPQKLDEMLTKETLLEDSSNEDKFIYYFKLAGSQKVFDKLNKESKKVDHIECHMRLHDIGRVFYKVFRETSYIHDNYMCAAGIAHGAMEEYIYQRGMDNLENEINDLCKNYKSEFQKLNCFHGTGHGIAVTLNWDLEQSIKTCKSIKMPYYQDMCFSGVFMENNFQDEKNKKNPDNPVYPCNQPWIADSEQTLRTCFQNQIRSIRLAHDNSFEKTIAFCATLSKNLQTACYQAVGREASIAKLPDPLFVANVCKKVPDEYYRPCLERSLFFEIAANGLAVSNQAKIYCNAVKDKDRSYCYDLVGRSVPNMFNKPKNENDLEVVRKKIRDVCDTAYIDDCFRGARTKISTL